MFPMLKRFALADGFRPLTGISLIFDDALDDIVEFFGFRPLTGISLIFYIHENNEYVIMDVSVPLRGLV